MRILIKLGMLFLALMLAVNLAVALVKFILQPIILAYVAIGCVLAFGLAAGVAGFRHGNATAAWQGGLDGAGWVLRTIVKAGRFIVSLAFGFVKTLAR